MRGSAVPLAEPFFTLEYDPGTAAFRREIPANAEDLGDGLFRRDGKVFRLPGDSAGEMKILRQKCIGGKDLLALVRRGYNPLIKAGPVPAERGDRLMELGLLGGLPGPVSQGRKTPGGGKGKNWGGGFREIRILFRMGNVPEEAWLPLEGLPNYRLRENRIYEIIPGDVLERFFPLESSGGGRSALTLRDEEIPAFADNHARLVYMFADKLLYSLLSQENLFVDPEKISLVLRCAPVIERGVGAAAAEPALKYGDKLYSALALSRRFHQKYILLEDRWIRRESLEAAGIGPLGRFVNGESLSAFRVKPRDALLRGGDRLAGLWQGFEWARDNWVEGGGEEEIFFGHLEFLRHWGIPGGIISSDREKAARHLVRWLRFLAGEFEGEVRREGAEDLFAGAASARALVLMAGSFGDKWLSKELPLTGEGPLTVPPLSCAGAASVWDPYFRGVGLEFYRNLPRRPRYGRRTPAWDILVLLGAGEALQGEAGFREDLFRELKAVPARLRLGVFFSSGEIFQGSKSRILKAFFGLKGELAEFEKYLIRETGDFLSLPLAYRYTPPLFLKPPRPWEGAVKTAAMPKDKEKLSFDGETLVIGGGCFVAETKFQKINTPEYQEEQELFRREGEQRPFTVPSPEQDAAPDFRVLTEEEKNYFLYWRAEFRKGRVRETGRAYIRLYCRELILLMGGLSSRNAYAELMRLCESYGAIFPDLGRRFSQWLLDFAVLYNCADLYTPFPGDTELCADLWLHRKYIEENHSPEFADFVSLVPEKIAAGPFRAEGPLLDERVTGALAAVDGALRKGYGKRLLEFFYPLPPRKELVTAFEGLGGMGYSSYTAQWLSFSTHRPLANFLSSLTAWLEYRLMRETGFDAAGPSPPLDFLWKYMAGLSEAGEGVPEELGKRPLELEPERINRLREESDAVMEMLKTENTGEEYPEAPSPLDPETSFGKTRSSPGGFQPEKEMAEFVASLDETSLAVLELICRGGSRRELDALAREQGTMAALVIDEINECFMEIRGDLLIEDAVDEGPAIQAEYKDEVVWALTFRNGSAPQ
jgi:hypothetical protein